MNGIQIRESFGSTEIDETTNTLVRLLGMKIAPGDEKAFEDGMDELWTFIQRNYQYRTHEEIRQAYEWLVTGKLGIEVFRELNPVAFGRVMKAYDDATRQDRAFISEKINALPEPGQSQPSAEELDLIFEKSLQEARSMVETGATFFDYGNYLYGELEARKMASWTKAEKKAAMEEARKQLAAEKTAQRDQETNSIRRMDFERAIQAISDGTAENQIIPRAKRILVNQYLRQQ